MFALTLEEWGWVGLVVQAGAAVFGLPAVAISVLLLTRQTKAEAAATERRAIAEEATVYHSLIQLNFAIDQLFIERPELRPYYYNNTAIRPGDAEYGRVMSIAEMMVDFMDAVVAQKNRLGDDLAYSYLAYFADLFRLSPALRQYWIDCGHWYPERLRGVLAQVIDVDLASEE